MGALHLDVIVEAPRLPKLDETLVGQGVSYRLGGKGGNQAVAAARMGAKVAMAGAVGSDAFAETLLAGLDAAGVDRALVARREGASGMSAAILDANGDYGAVIVSGANLSVTGDAPVPTGTSHVLLQNEIPEAANLAAARAGRAAGAKIILNAAPARAMAPELLALTDILIVNRGEADALTDYPDMPPQTAAQLLVAMGPAHAVITLGGEGYLCQSASGKCQAEVPPKVEPQSTHGAGDAFTGVLAARLDAGEGLNAALNFAQKAAALHVSTPPERRHQIGPDAVAAL